MIETSKEYIIIYIVFINTHFNVWGKYGVPIEETKYIGKIALHNPEIKFYETCHRLCYKLVRGSRRVQRARKLLKLQFYYDAMYQSL